MEFLQYGRQIVIRCTRKCRQFQSTGTVKGREILRSCAYGLHDTFCIRQQDFAGLSQADTCTATVQKCHTYTTFQRLNRVTDRSLCEVQCLSRFSKGPILDDLGECSQLV